jgi:hypothetical protein
MRIRWTFSPLGDLFVVYNHNLRHDINGDTNPLLVERQHAFRY